ncbi:MAG: DUF1292 domain-containing protein [Clostridia bacterium]|nr:DUF1292 domain-containing protein [Clostridia bacterium]
MENYDELDNTIVLNDEDGNEVLFEFLDLIEYKERTFVVLLPCEECDEPDRVLILELEQSEPDSGFESYISVEDEELLGELFDLFKEKFKDKFEFID